jgi:hypothetical protein
MESYWMLFFGVFAAETIKNIAKGSANLLQENLHSILKPEFTALNLSIEDSPEAIQKKFEARPEIKEAVRHKLEADPDLLNQLVTVLKKNDGRTINTKTYIENAGNITINQ